MKIDIKINIYFVLWFLIISVTSIILFILTLQHAEDYYAYHKYISDNQKDNIDWYYNCDSEFNSKFYNCPLNESYKNITGYYCNNELICENKYKIK